eukprot:m.245282 g.245282  ORF g.245282 m.245282 type:complete len:528 (+) comp14658_c0_seq1:48-1631(+)
MAAARFNEAVTLIAAGQPQPLRRFFMDHKEMLSERADTKLTLGIRRRYQCFLPYDPKEAPVDDFAGLAGATLLIAATLLSKESAVHEIIAGGGRPDDKARMVKREDAAGRVLYSYGECTALHVCDNAVVCRKLLAAGASRTAKTACGKTPLEAAQARLATVKSHGLEYWATALAARIQAEIDFEKDASRQDAARKEGARLDATRNDMDRRRSLVRDLTRNSPVSAHTISVLAEHNVCTEPELRGMGKDDLRALGICVGDCLAITRFFATPQPPSPPKPAAPSAPPPPPVVLPLSPAAIERVLSTHGEQERTLPPLLGLMKTTLPLFASAATAFSEHIGAIDEAISSAVDFGHERLAARSDRYGLTADEISAICLYTMEFDDSNVAAALAAAVASTDRKAAQAFYPYLRLLLSGLLKLPRVAATLYRGVLDDGPTTYVKDTTLIWWNIVSCCRAENVLRHSRFASATSPRTGFRIETKSAVDISPYSVQMDDGEFVLLPGASFRVAGIDKGASLVVSLIEGPSKLLQG